MMGALVPGASHTVPSVLMWAHGSPQGVTCLTQGAVDMVSGAQEGARWASKAAPDDLHGTYGRCVYTRKKSWKCSAGQQQQ